MVRDALGMHRAPVLTLLRAHSARALDSHEASMTALTRRFVEENADCFWRTQLTGHLTGSAWIVSPDRTQVLLMHHRKLDKWLQLGGHADGDGDLTAVALREAQEESGLSKMRLVSNEIFDVDRHQIPERQGEPGHWHYDLRFLIEADPADPLVATNESKALAWYRMAQVSRLTQEESIARMVRKTQPSV
jgi:8-oxo-dGTP pyrophosphatase MutT (NUDIX family)